MNEIINYELNSCIEGTKRQNHISGRKVGSRTAIYSSFHVHAASRKTPSEDRSGRVTLKESYVNTSSLANKFQTLPLRQEEQQDQHWEK